MGIVNDASRRDDVVAAAAPPTVDRDEFARLAGEHRPRAMRFATAFVGDRHAAEDMVQEALRRLYEARDRYPLRDLFGPYLVKTVARLCIDQRRGRRAERRRLLRLPVTAPPAPTVAVEERETAGQVAAAVAALPERERACFLLTVCEGLSYRDAAEALGLSFAEVNNAIHRARRGLRASLGALVAIETRHR
ncbi:MAG: RNA polymerase sigma factor [Planctomycetia bacterium]